MSDETTPQQTTPVTAREAVENTARILRHAEAETNLPVMERLDELANTWLQVAYFLAAHKDDMGE